MFSIRGAIWGLALSGILQSALWAQQSGTGGTTTEVATASKHTAETPKDSITKKQIRSGDAADEDARYELTPGVDPDNHLILPFAKHLASDQYNFWTTPAHFHVKDLEWGVPFVGVTAGFMAGDSWLSKQIPLGEISRSKTISDYGAYSFIGAGAGAFVLGHMTGNDRMSETGLLSGEAAINSTAVAYLFKTVTQRPRPFQDKGNGTFFQGGSSFPSEHAAIAWSVASVMAHEYPGTLTKILAYGLATTVSATRVTGQQHFASDVIIGSALGWYFGRQVYRSHHDTDLGGAAWGDILPESSGEKTRNPENMGSPYVPLDNWVYPALERLAAMGYIKTAYLGIRPWTRLECARMLDEAQQNIADEDDQSGAAARIYSELAKEFAAETGRLNGAANVGASLDSVYARVTNISGPPLRDGYHFGQTVINDYGRPYGEGFSSVDGFTSHAEAGPLSISVRGEYQHAPAVTPYSSQALAATAAVDGVPPLPGKTDATSQFQLLDSAVSLDIKNVQLSFGKQSEWLGPGESGPLLRSNNAPPFLQFKIDQVSPVDVPGISRILGPIRTMFFIGRLEGHRWERCVIPSCQTYPGFFEVVGPTIVPQPFIHSGMFSFKPSPNLEIGFSYAAMFGGPGLPVTFGTFFHTFYVHTPNLAVNPGKRASAVNFSYRVPGIRNWMTLYLDSMTWDEVSPIGSTRANVNPGIYMPKLPMLPKLQLRAEGFNIARTREFPSGWVYFNTDRYLSGYTNDGQLMGNWIGRAGRGGQGWLTYWFSPRMSLQAAYRLQTVSPKFLEGGRLVDYSGKGEFQLTRNFSISGLWQYEQWRFPVISTSRQSDAVTSIQLNFKPHWNSK